MSRRMQGRMITAAAIVPRSRWPTPFMRRAAAHGAILQGCPAPWQWLAEAWGGAKPPIAKAGAGVDPDGRQAPETASGRARRRASDGAWK